MEYSWKLRNLLLVKKQIKGLGEEEGATERQKQTLLFNQ